MAACAAFKDAFDRRYQEAAALEEEGGLTAERTREIQRELEHNITELEPSQVWHTCCWAVLRPTAPSAHVRLSAAARRNVTVVRAWLSHALLLIDSGAGAVVPPNCVVPDR